MTHSVFRILLSIQHKGGMTVITCLECEAQRVVVVGGPRDQVQPDDVLAEVDRPGVILKTAMQTKWILCLV